MRTDSIRLLPVRVSESAATPCSNRRLRWPRLLRLCPDPRRVPSTSSFPKSICGLKAALMLCSCVWCWCRCNDDHAAAEDAHLDSGRGDRPATRLRRAECSGADQAGTESVLGPCVCLPRPSRESCDIVRHYASSFKKPGSLRVLFSCNTVEFNGLRAITCRTPIFSGSDSRAATGTCHGVKA